jgi:hypothetical protein
MKRVVAKKRKRKVKPNCYTCKWSRSIPGDCHKSCANADARVVGNPVGIRGGWFCFPFNFDPVWVDECDGYEKA